MTTELRLHVQSIDVAARHLRRWANKIDCKKKPPSPKTLRWLAGHLETAHIALAKHLIAVEKT